MNEPGVTAGFEAVIGLEQAFARSPELAACSALAGRVELEAQGDLSTRRWRFASHVGSPFATCALTALETVATRAPIPPDATYAPMWPMRVSATR